MAEPIGGSGLTALPHSLGMGKAGAATPAAQGAPEVPPSPRNDSENRHGSLERSLSL